MDAPGHRVVTLVLCTPRGELLGVPAPLEVAVPWWQEAAPVVAAAHDTYGIDVTILRRVAGGGDETPPGGPVCYLAETSDAVTVPLRRWTGPDPLAEVAHRLPWARPGGPAADVAWADGVLAALDRPRTGAAVQIRTWNLSSIWRLPTAAGNAWLKVVPPFFAHEGEMLARLDRSVAPPLIAHEGLRTLLDDIAGEDLYDARGAVLLRMVEMLVGLQRQWIGRTDELSGIGLPDWRHPAIRAAAADTLDRSRHELDGDTCARLDELIGGLTERYAALASCGVPDTLVHGDFHPGNVRGDDAALTLLDWGDCGVGNPLLDQAAFTSRIPDQERSAVAVHWARAWRHAVPGCDPERAAELLAPVAALRQAVVYRRFLDNIEPDEHIYHAADPADWLRRAAQAVVGAG